MVGLFMWLNRNGGAPTEFVLTELKTRAVFDNPRHDYPKRIVYELTENGCKQPLIHEKEVPQDVLNISANISNCFSYYLEALMIPNHDEATPSSNSHFKHLPGNFQ
ncbi:MAG: hypothetical protein U0905_19075 [Pirellulales bacterium]